MIVGFTPLGPPSTVDLTFLNINDFHGRIDANTVKFAGTVEQLRAAGGEANTAFLAAGDNISASLFASAVQGDQPTIDVLNALGLQATATGNHEFDKGYDDLINRVIAGGTNAKYKILGANVYDSTGEPALDEYAIIDVGGVQVGVIGAVTEETSALVSPGGIVGLTFGDPVEAVNRVAEQLSDGDPSNGEAELLIAEYHEGAPEGTPDGATLEEEVAASPVFASIVNETSPLVDAIFTGHTHKAYAWDGPIPGQPGETRPVVQTGNYGENVGKVVLTVNLASHDVTAYTSALVPRTTVADSTLVAQYPRVAAVKTIVDAALAYAAVVGNQPVGSVTADITTAFSNGAYTNGVYTGGTRDDRSKESTLGDLVADALLDSLADPSRGGATIGVVNPGGLRGDLFYAPDGVVTYAEANSILPFVNNLWTVTLTGTQFKTMLEQQWQRDAAGNVPTRAYLQLGLSKNVTYTFDATLPEGSRITSITVDGQPINPTGSYRIGTFSFLTTGGDNFRIFTQGTDARDSGLVDRDAWIDYISAHSPLTPDFARQAVVVSNLPTTASIGSTLSFGMSGLDLTSLGSPLNTSISASIGGVNLGSTPVAGGAASLSLVLPAGVPTGQQSLMLTASPSGTTVTIPLTIADPRVASTTTLSLSKTSQVYGTRSPAVAKATVTLVNGAAPTGSVEFADNGVVVATVSLTNGAASYTLPRTAAVGVHSIVATYTGAPTALSSASTAKTVTVTKASSTSVLLPDRIIQFRGGTPAKLTTYISASTDVPTDGTVTFRRNGTIVATVDVVNGRAAYTLPASTSSGIYIFTATYSGSTTVNGSTSNLIPIIVLGR